MVPPSLLARPVIVRFGRRLRELRRAAGLTQRDLARQSRVTRKFIQEVEDGTSNPSLETIVLLADGLGCEVADLFQSGS